MNVHPNYFGNGVGSQLLQHIVDYTNDHGYEALRLTSSATNLDSFSLYNKAGFVPRQSFQDMITQVPDAGMQKSTPGDDRVRDARLDDVAAMAALEHQVSGITREIDYKYCIENKRGYWHASVIESPSGDLDGYIISCGHQAMNMLGPCIARTEDDAAALILHELNQHPGRRPVCLIPMQCEKLVKQMYDWGARNCEMHFCQVYGKFQPFDGISMPTFLPETG
jgi:hypothetical protein